MGEQAMVALPTVEQIAHEIIEGDIDHFVITEGEPRDTYATFEESDADNRAMVLLQAARVRSLMANTSRQAIIALKIASVPESSGTKGLNAAFSWNQALDAAAALFGESPNETVATEPGLLTCRHCFAPIVHIEADVWFHAAKNDPVCGPFTAQPASALATPCSKDDTLPTLRSIRDSMTGDQQRALADAWYSLREASAASEGVMEPCGYCRGDGSIRTGGVAAGCPRQSCDECGGTGKKSTGEASLDRLMEKVALKWILDIKQHDLTGVERIHMRVLHRLLDRLTIGDRPEAAS